MGPLLNVSKLKNVKFFEDIEKLVLGTINTHFLSKHYAWYFGTKGTPPFDTNENKLLHFIQRLLFNNFQFFLPNFPT